MTRRAQPEYDRRFRDLVDRNYRAARRFNMLLTACAEVGGLAFEVSMVLNELGQWPSHTGIVIGELSGGAFAFLAAWLGWRRF